MEHVQIFNMAVIIGTLSDEVVSVILSLLDIKTHFRLTTAKCHLLYIVIYLYIHIYILFWSSVYSECVKPLNVSIRFDECTLWF